MKRAFSDAWAGTRPFRPVMGVVIVLCIMFAIWQPGFRTSLNVQNILSSVSVLWIVAMGMTLVLISGGFDLSVGAISTISGVFLAKVLSAGLLPGPLALIATIIFGAILGGVLNGIFVGIFRLSVFVVTLASMTALTGMVLVWTNTQSVYVTSSTISAISVQRVGGLQTPIYIMAVVFILFLFIQKRTYFGRDVYATGGSYTAARLSGIRTGRTLIAVYAVVGACAGLGGAIAVGRTGAAVPNVDPNLALQSVAAVLLGGTALTGGFGSMVGTAFGALFIGILQNGLNLVGVGSAWQYVVTGVILLVSVLGSRVGGGRGTLLGRLIKTFKGRKDAPLVCAVDAPAAGSDADKPQT
jgi:ribose transport system permease protein